MKALEIYTIRLGKFYLKFDLNDEQGYFNFRLTRNQLDASVVYRQEQVKELIRLTGGTVQRVWG